MADPNDLYEAYAQANLDSGGRLQKGSSRLGGLFDLEGPESLGQFVDIPGFGSSPGGRLAAMMELRDNLDFENEDLLAGYLEDISQRTMDDNFSIPVEGLVPDEGGFFTGGGALTTPSGGQFSIGDEDIAGMAEAYRSIQDNAIDPELDYFPSGPLGMSLSKAALLEGRVADSDLAAREMLGEEAAFESSPLDDIASLLASLDNTEGNMTAFDRKVNADNFMSQEAEVDSIDDLIAESSTSAADRARIAANAADEDEAMSQSLTPEAIEGGFQAGMQDFMDAAGIDDTPEEGETKEEALERYKKEFSDATGIDASGKVDKSRALMAFGLALMQNKAGKGFNVGRMLTSVSEAGEAALPALDKATADAKAARISAGKYALTQRQSDVDARLASAAAAKDFQQQVYLKWYDSSLKREELNLEAEADLLTAAAEDSPDYGKKHEFEFTTGQTSFKIPVVYDESSPSAGVILKPDPYARKYIDGRAGVEDALDVISTMRSASQEIADGGGTTKFAYDRVNSIAKALFPDLNTGEPSSEQEYAQGVNLIMGRFKRFLTQETGNGISNRDVEIWENEIMKKPGWFTNFDETASALDQLEDIFRSKLGEFDAGIDFIYDEANLLPGDYEKLVEKYGDVSQIQGNTGKLVFKDGRIVRSQ